MNAHPQVAKLFNPSALLGLALAALLAFGSVAGAEEPRLNEVKLPLREYLDLVEAAKRAEKERAQAVANRVDPLAEVTSQRTHLSIDGGVAHVVAEFEVLVQGHPKSPVELPAQLVTRTARVERAGAATASVHAALSADRNRVFLIAPDAGRYAVRLEGESHLSQEGGVTRYVMAPAAAPVALAELELPAEMEWSVPGAVVVEDRVADGRRTIRFTSRRGTAPVIDVHPKRGEGDADRLLAQAVVLTLFQLGPEGAQRHDVILYDVARGSLDSFTVELPTGLEIDKAGTDEGEIVPVTEGRRLTLHRRSQLQKTGYLILTSTPDVAGELTLAPLLPGVEVRARYIAIASTVAAEAKPEPEASWTRVDLEDLPSSFREALSALDPSAAWRLNDKAGDGSGSHLAVARVRTAPLLPAVVRSRETTTVVTVDGTVLHRDRFVLHPIAGVASALSALDVTLPPGGTLWSVKVDMQPVRPLEKNGVVTIPLGFNEGKGPVVEVVSVLEKGIPKGRSRLALTLPRLAAPVQDHRWRLLLPAGNRYRFARGDLKPRPAPPAPEKEGFFFRHKQKAPMSPAPPPPRPGVPQGAVGGVEGGVAATSPLRDERRISTGATVSSEELEKIPTSRDPWAILEKTPGVLTDRINVGGNESGAQASYYDRDAFEQMKKEVADLKNGTVAGVRSLPVTIPESGKVLDLAGFLPPAEVSVELEVKGGK